MPCKLAITSISLGRCSAGHSLRHRLDLAQSHGYHGIELFYEEITHIAQQLPGGPTEANQLTAAHTIAELCRERNLTILCLQPFWHYEGLRDRAEHAKRLVELTFWFRLTKALGTDLIQIPSNFLPASQLSPDDDYDLTIGDLQEAAEMGAREEPPVRFVYEALCWGTHCNTWEASWMIVQAVNRPNFGLCLDTFNIAGRAYADPASPTGCVPDCDKAIRDSLERLVATVDVAKVFSVQVVDAEKLSQPLVEGHQFYDTDQPARMSWSRNCRLFYGEVERGAYLPVKKIAEAIVRDLGYEGWVSMEFFHRRMADRDESVPEELAERGKVAWERLVRDVGCVDKAGDGVAIGMEYGR